MKRKWKRPELVVLIKGRPEENVLFHCKAGEHRLGPNSTAGYCKEPEGACMNCSGQEQT